MTTSSEKAKQFGKLGQNMVEHGDVTGAKTMAQTAPNPDPSHVAIWIALNRSRVALMRRVDKKLRDAGLPPLTWYDVLWSVEKRGGTARPAEVIDDLLFEPSALSHMLRRIEAAGLLKVSMAKDDKRGRMLQMTSKGKEARAAIWQIYGVELEKRLAPLGALPNLIAVAEALGEISDPHLD